jgi:hypothetical protein
VFFVIFLCTLCGLKKLNRIVAVQDRDATMTIKEQMPGAKKLAERHDKS